MNFTGQMRRSYLEYARRRLSAGILAAATLAGCAGGNLAGDEADKDGQTFAAKPGMARLYLIHGYLTTGTVTRPSGETIPGSATIYYYETADQLSPGGVALVNTLAGGPLAGIVAGSAAAEDATPVEQPNRKRRLWFTYKYFLNDKYIGDIGSEQYMALDLAPGTYKIFFEQPAGTSSVAPVNLNAGETQFFLSNGARHMGAYWEKCGDDCAPLVRDGHRVTADLSGQVTTDSASH